MRITKIKKILNRSRCVDKRNLQKVVKILGRDYDFFVFMINIIMDFSTRSLAEAYLEDFFNNYNAISLTLSRREIARKVNDQIKFHFRAYRLKSVFRLNIRAEHINVIPYNIFRREHMRISTDLNRLYRDPSFYLSFLRPETLRGPYRRRSRPIQPRHSWLAVRSEVESAITAHPSSDPGTAVNDIIGLGFKDTRRPGSRTLLFQVVFPVSFSNQCFKPTFVDGPLSNYQKSYFMNAKNNRGYGLTWSTDKGQFQVRECITDSIRRLTPDFKIESIGYAQPIIDKSNMKEGVLRRFLTL